MSKVRAHISISLDGYVAGPDQTQDEPLGAGGEELHTWVVGLRAWREPHGLQGGEENVSSDVLAEAEANVGAEIMGRGKFGPASRGPWGDDPWEGWWGDEPPFHQPVFVVTHDVPAEAVGGVDPAPGDDPGTGWSPAAKTCLQTFFNALAANK